MKKVYRKPMARLEMFTLSQNVAVDCGYSKDKYMGFPTHRDIGSCGWNDGVLGEVIWTQKDPCDGVYPEDAEVGEVCYNNPSGAGAAFSSM